FGIGAESQCHPPAATLAFHSIGSCLRPGLQSRQDFLADEGRRPIAPVFPRKETVPIMPACSLAGVRCLLACQAQIAHGNNALPRRISTISICKRVKLLYITKRMMRLCFHPGTQA